MQLTQLTYLEDSYLFSFQSKILDVQKLEDGRIALILDDTIFYPQGGGQPYDQGIIESESGKFQVDEVRFKDGLVYHIGKYIQGEFQVGQKVFSQINEERRRLNARLHSAGHLLDFVLKNLGKEMKAIKGYHFSDGPYVEYEGVVKDDERESLTKKIEHEMNHLVQLNILVETTVIPIENMLEFCDSIPEYLPKNKPARVVSFCFANGKKGIPCGGTHVQNLSEIGGIIIVKLSTKNGNTRISYRVM